MAETGEITTAGPQGELHGSYFDAGANAPIVLIVPGSGPTDRDGNSPLGVRAATYRLIAEGLAERGISSVRIDKRGMFASSGAIADANAVTIADYVSDVSSWIGAIKNRTGNSCVWLLGHSEGGLVALATAQKPQDICGLLLIAAPGRKLGDMLRAQLEANPANAPVLPQALQAIAKLEAGGEVDTATLDPALTPLFSQQIQGFLRDLFSHDPATLMAGVTVPTLILQGEADLQINPGDARLLAAAKSDATMILFPGVNHLLKAVPTNDTAANLAAYADPSLPLAPPIIGALADFILLSR